MSEYRVGELAALAGVSVELLRSYQSKGLLPPPRHHGRVAFYDRRHLERLAEIRALKSRGYSLKAIGEVVVSRPAVSSSSSVGASSLAFADDDDDQRTYTLREVAQHSGVPSALLRSLEASGVLRPQRFGDTNRYTSFDVRAVRMLLSLLGSGLPMEEFMRVAKVQIEAADQVAEGAVELFLRYVRDPLRRSGMTEVEEAQRLAAGFRLMLDAATMLLTYNFNRMVINAVQVEIDNLGSEAEREALRQELRHHLNAAVPV
jgi:DNA-binding transcriptional MerR regulator